MDASIAEQKNQVDYVRHGTHRIYNVAKDVKENIFKR